MSAASGPNVAHFLCAALLLVSSWTSLRPAESGSAQSRFVDDANREVTLSSSVERVFAAGAPAEVLLHTLAPEKLVGRNRIPEGDAVEFFPSPYRTPVLIRRLPSANDPAGDAEFRALKPDLYVDYGTVDQDYVAVVDAVQKRTGTAGVILDGGLERIPATYRRLGKALGVQNRGEHLAAATEHILNRYRNSLRANGATPRVYLACSSDVVIPCYSDERGGEVLEWLGGSNVAGASRSAPMRPLTVDEIRKFEPRFVVVHGGAQAVERLRSTPEWSAVPAIAEGRVLGWPNLPYSWGSRPPSVNRLIGLIWLSAVASGRSPNAVTNDIRGFFRDYYQVELTDAQLRTLLEG